MSFLKEEGRAGTIFLLLATFKFYKIQCKKGMYFSCYFGWYSFHLDFVLGTGGWDFWLNGQNLLSMTKVICWQSLHPRSQELHKYNSVSSNDPINTNHGKFIWLEVITLILNYSVWEKTITQFFTTSENLQDNFILPHTTLGPL